MELKCKVQNYEWGKRGTQSKVATLFKSANPEFNVEENLPYSELWVGTHVSGPSVVKASGELLSELIKKHPEYLGEDVCKCFGQELPFLFKVLSVEKALSIQAHPSKKHAEELHKTRPDIYKDPNHKPELAIALTPFEALCGFRTISEITFFLKKIPELRNLIGDTVLEQYAGVAGEDLLKEAVKAVLTTTKDVLSVQLTILLERFKVLCAEERKEQLADLVERLYSNFPGDVGCFMVYFLNYITLKPSEALYLGANEPHAYLYGDCVECMACSDNVVRAGLTPKLIDVETLCSMLIYKGETPAQKIFRPVIEDEFSQIFKPPVPDFAVVEIKVPLSAKKYKTEARSSASTLIVVSGKGKTGSTELRPGSTFFIPANQSFEVAEILDDLLMYQGLANV